MVSQTIKIAGKHFVLVEKTEYDRLRLVAGRLDALLPALPEPDARGTRPAVATGRVILARGLIRDRLKAGLTQRELARLAGIRPETLSRLEAGRYTPTQETVERLDRALAGASRRAGRSVGPKARR
jgi:DNA-binding XRE family transcriptional regulator